MHYPDSDQIGKPCMIQWQNSYDSIVLTKDNGVIQSLLADHRIPVLMKDTGVIQGLPIGGEQLKAKKKLNKLN